jgi:hypothetical protein
MHPPGQPTDVKVNSAVSTSRHSIQSTLKFPVT